MKRLFFLIVLMILFVGCESTTAPKIQTTAENVTIVPTHIATFEIEGMMCQKGCGAIIRKGLYETGGVAEVEVLFNEENPVNEIKVYFDIKKTSTDKMITVIGNLAEMRYSARLKKVTESTIASANENRQPFTF